MLFYFNETTAEMIFVQHFFSESVLPLNKRVIDYRGNKVLRGPSSNFLHLKYSSFAKMLRLKYRAVYYVKMFIKCGHFWSSRRNTSQNGRICLLYSFLLLSISYVFLIGAHLIVIHLISLEQSHGLLLVGLNQHCPSKTETIHGTKWKSPKNDQKN